MKVFFRTVGDGNVGTFDYQLGFQAVHVILVYNIGPRRGNPDFALDVNHRVTVELLSVRIISHTLACLLQLDQCENIKPLGIVDRAPGICYTHQHGSLSREEASGVLAHGTEALDDDSSPVHIEVTVLKGNFCGVTEAPPRRPDLVEGDSTEVAGQPHHPTDLILHPGHALLIGAHVRSEYILLNFSQ